MSVQKLFKSETFYLKNSLLGWWSIDEGSKEEQARLFYAGTTGSVSYLLTYGN